MSVFASIANPGQDDDITEELTKMTISPPSKSENFFSSRSRSPRGFKPPTIFIPTEDVPTEDVPTEKDFINFYFKDKDRNENIKRIYEKYMEVKENFEKEKTPHSYIDTNTVPKKQQSSAGWELVYKNKPYAYNVNSQKVTLDIEGKTYKDFIVNKDEYATIFMITLEIAMQTMAYDILKSETDIIIPEITNHYLIDLNEDNCRIIIEMDYIEHKDLQEGKVDKAMKALDILRDHNIYHFDTHNENIVQSVKDDQVVILDFGKAQITKTPDISSTSGLFKVHEDTKDPIKFNYNNWISKPKKTNNSDNPDYIDSHIIKNDIDFYGGKKTKSKRKTKKGKKKGKSKKTKKRTYRKRK